MHLSKPYSPAAPGRLHLKLRGNRRPAVAAAALATLLVAAAAFASPPAFKGASQTYYYYSGGRQQPLTLNTQRLVVRFAESTQGKAQVRAVASAYPDLELVEQTGIGEKFRLEVFQLYDPGAESVINKIEELNSRPDVEFAGPIFDSGGIETILTDEIWVQFRDDLTPEEVNGMMESLGVQVVEKKKWDRYSYIVRVTERSPGDALTVANSLWEDDRVLYSHPNFVLSLRNTHTPNDTRYPPAWNLNHIGQRPGNVDADIDAPEGWDLSKGSSSVVVAVLDGHGVQIGHPDFSGKIDAGSYDYYSGDSDPSPPNGCEAHGTNCAGIAAAVTNNSLGIAAVGYNVKLMGARIGSDPDCDGSFSSTANIIDDAIRGCADAGADVESNSWSVGSNDIDQIHNAIIYAKTNGRGGLGTVVCFSSGNGNTTPIEYPARYSECIAVGATNWCDERKRAVNNTCNNNEYWWGSNYGANLDVVAPGVAVWATDVTGSDGYNAGGDTLDGDAAGDYFKWFNGTSAACPHVAGLAGLCISVNSSLTASQVQTYIQNGADDQVGLPAEDTAGFDNYMGWGRINVYNTLMLIAQPNLVSYTPSGWTYPLVPRNTNDATNSYCPVPDSLYGNQTSTYLNWAWKNDATVGCAGHRTQVYLDEAYVAFGTVGGLLAGQGAVAKNVGVLNVRGGRHTLSDTLDTLDEVTESNENDNAYARQFVWTPYLLSEHSPVHRGAPPERGGSTYPNCDGFQFTGNWMGAVGMISDDASCDYDVRLHNPYAGSESGFGSYLDWSSASGSFSDFVLYNGNVVGYGSTFDASVYHQSGSRTAGFYVEQANSEGTLAPPVDTGTYTISSTGILNVHEIHFLEEGSWTVEVENVSGNADLGVTIYGWDKDYVDKYEYMPGGFGNASGGGYDEKITVDIDTTRYFPLAVWKNGPSDIGKTATYKLHIYKTPPNLTTYVFSGWDYTLVPRDTAGATLSYAPLTDSLPGNVGGTYMNFGWINEGPDTAFSHQTRIFVDDAYLVTGYVGKLNPGQPVGATNWGPYTIRGGRHTVSDTIDYLDQVLETDEADNWWSSQFVWTPYVLADQVPVNRSAPPVRGGGTYPNCDGFQYTGGWWSAVAMMPQNSADDYEVRLHNQYGGSLDGFGPSVDLSYAGQGQIDFVISNGNHASVGFGATRDVGVSTDAGDPDGPTGGFCVEFAKNAVTYAAPFDAGVFSMGTDNIIDMYEVRIPVKGNWTVELDMLSGNADLGVSMYDWDVSYFDKYETMPGAISYSAGPGQDELFTAEIDTTNKYFGIAVWKTRSADLNETCTYRLKVYETPPNLTYSTPPGWSYPVTPRNTGDALEHYAPIPPELPGNVDSTWLNVSWTNDGPDTAGPHWTYLYVDNVLQVSMHRIADLLPNDTLFVRNLGPYTVRGGRHTLSEYIDVLDEVLETNEADNNYARQFVWSPLELVMGSPVTRSAPPDPGIGTYPNCDGYHFDKVSTYTQVVAMCPLGNEDYDLLLYSDYSGSESGFSDLKTSSAYGSGLTEFVGARYYNYAEYPAAILGLPATKVSGTKDPAKSPAQSDMVVDATNSNGKVYSTASLPVSVPDSLPANRLINVYDFELQDSTSYDIHLQNLSGDADLAVAIMPLTANYWGRGGAAVEKDTAGAGGHEMFAFAPPASGWYELVVYKTGYTEVGKQSSYILHVGEPVTAVAEMRTPPSRLTMSGNYPNPFNPATTIRYGVPEPGGHVAMRVFDATGRLVRTLVDREMRAGYYTALWNGMSDSGEPLASGIYFCRLEVAGTKLTQKMLLLK